MSLDPSGDESYRLLGPNLWWRFGHRDFPVQADLTDINVLDHLMLACYCTLQARQEHEFLGMYLPVDSTRCALAGQAVRRRIPGTWHTWEGSLTSVDTEVGWSETMRESTWFSGTSELARGTRRFWKGTDQLRLSSGMVLDFQQGRDDSGDPLVDVSCDNATVASFWLGLPPDHDKLHAKLWECRWYPEESLKHGFGVGSFQTTLCTTYPSKRRDAPNKLGAMSSESVAVILAVVSSISLSWHRGARRGG